MKALTNIAAIAIVLILTTFAAAQAPKTGVTTFQLGNQATVIPAPDGFEEAAGQFEVIKDQFTRTEAPDNDMLAVHLPRADCDKLRMGETVNFSFYTKVSIRRSNRTQDYSTERFADLVAAFRKTSTEVLDINGPTLKNAVQQLDKAMSDINKKETKFSLSQPVNLGEFDTRPNVYGVILLVTVTTKSGDGEISVPLVGGLTYVRVKQRLLYVYTYRRYSSANDVQVVRDFTKQWISKILAAN